MENNHSSSIQCSWLIWGKFDWRAVINYVWPVRKIYQASLTYLTIERDRQKSGHIRGLVQFDFAAGIGVELFLVLKISHDFNFIIDENSLIDCAVLFIKKFCKFSVSQHEMLKLIDALRCVSCGQ